jgi:hypothetical protein
LFSTIFSNSFVFFCRQSGALAADAIYILQTTGEEVYNIMIKDTLPPELEGKLSKEELTDLIEKVILS